MSAWVGPSAEVSVPLLVIIFTQASNTARRSWQRRTWLKQRWTRGEVAKTTEGSTPSDRVAWRYVYMQARDSDAAGGEEFDVIRGDTVTLSSVRESYANLVFKTLEALRWALRHVAFGTMLKTDDDSIVRRSEA